MIIHRTEPTDKLQFQTFSPAIPDFKPCKYNPRNKNGSVLGCACILANTPSSVTYAPGCHRISMKRYIIAILYITVLMDIQ